MRAVMDVSEEFLAERHRLGHDRWDEMWEGVLHMPPPPHGEHGRLNDDLGVFFKVHWEASVLGRTYPETGVRRPGARWIKVAGEKVPSDYKTPDRSFLLPARYGRFKNGWIVGGPDAVLEIVSPGDESYEKLPFYSSIGVREAIYIHRVSREVELRRRGKTDWARVAPDAQGWFRSRVLDTDFKREPDGRLRLRRTSEPSRETLVGS
jgi:Uma2 family endonuclease